MDCAWAHVWELTGRRLRDVEEGVIRGVRDPARDLTVTDYEEKIVNAGLMERIDNRTVYNDRSQNEFMEYFMM